MDNLQQDLQKVDTNMRHIHAAVDAEEWELALASAKRAQRNVRFLVRQLAELRDNATA